MLSCHQKRPKCYFQGCQREAIAIIAAVAAAETKDLEQKRSGVVGGLQECFNVGKTEEKVELKTKKQPLFPSREAEPFAFMSLSLAPGFFIKPSNHLNKYSCGCSTSH